MKAPRASVCVSIDLELIWGMWDTAKPADHQRCLTLERHVVQALVQILRRHRFPASWAIVGRLLDDSRGFDGLSGPRGNWFAPWALDMIRESSEPAHEIATHSYGHVYFDAITAAEARADLMRAREVHRAHGLPFTSLVFPRNKVAHLNVVRDVGLRVYRSLDAGWIGWCTQNTPTIRPAANLVDKILPTTPPVVELSEGEGLVELPSSLLFIGRNGLRRLAHPKVMRRKLLSGLERATNTGKLFHLWFHPSNFYFDTTTQLTTLEAFVREAARLRDRGQLEIRTMSDFADAPVTAVAA